MKWLRLLAAWGLVPSMLHAQTTVFANKNLPPDDGGPTFTAVDKGLGISVHLPAKVHDLNAINMTFRLINQTGGSVIIWGWGTVNRFDLKLEDPSGHELEPAAALREHRAEVSFDEKLAREPATPLSGELKGVELKNGSTEIWILHLADYYPLSRLGTYKLVVGWRNGNDFKFPGKTPRLGLIGSVLLQKTGNDISIYTAR